MHVYICIYTAPSPHCHKIHILFSRSTHTLWHACIRRALWGGRKIPQQLGIIQLTVWIEASSRRDLLCLHTQSLWGFNISTHDYTYKTHTHTHQQIYNHCSFQRVHVKPWSHDHWPRGSKRDSEMWLWDIMSFVCSVLGPHKCIYRTGSLDNTGSNEDNQSGWRNTDLQSDAGTDSL